jgi:hypothetical protein
MHSAPSATTVSGWSRVVAATPNSVRIMVAASGIRLDPPTRKIPTRSVADSRAESMVRARQPTVRAR